MFYDLFKKLCDERGISVSGACIEMGLSRSIAAKWKNTNTKPSADVLPRIADYFGVTTDYLLSGGEDEKTPALSKKDERDIEKRLEAILEDLESGQGSLAYSGEAMDDETRELLIKSLRNSMEVGKALAKKKYTPKKYRKE